MFSQPVLRFALMAAMSALILTAQQTGSGTVQGVVRGVSSAVVAGARVTIVNTATMVKLSTAANDVGFFAFPPTQPGSYTIHRRSNRYGHLGGQIPAAGWADSGD